MDLADINLDVGDGTVELPEPHVADVVAALPSVVHDFIVRYHDIWLAGGFVRDVVAGDMPSDIDLWSNDADALRRMARIFAADFAAQAAARTHITKQAVTVHLASVSHPVQFITRWVYPTPQQLVMSFDYTMCQAAVWYDHDSGRWRGVCHPRFVEHAVHHHLCYTAPERDEEPAGSLARLLKFTRRGHTTSADTVAKVIGRALSPQSVAIDHDLLVSTIRRSGWRRGGGGGY